MEQLWGEEEGAGGQARPGESLDPLPRVLEEPQLPSHPHSSPNWRSWFQGVTGEATGPSLGCPAVAGGDTARPAPYDTPPLLPDGTHLCTQFIQRSCPRVVLMPVACGVRPRHI